jgi:hypothetical protein
MSSREQIRRKWPMLLAMLVMAGVIVVVNVGGDATQTAAQLPTQTSGSPTTSTTSGAIRQPRLSARSINFMPCSVSSVVRTARLEA